jgi:outer membrane protein
MRARTIIRLTISAISALVFSAVAELKIGVVNSAVILSEYEGYKIAQQKFDKEVAKWEQEATERQKEMLTLKDQLEKQSLLLSEERKKEIEAQLQAKSTEYQQFLNQKFGQQGEAAKKNEELAKPVLERINAIIDQIAKTDNYDMIFDRQAGGILFFKTAYDLTSRVLQVLSAEK